MAKKTKKKRSNRTSDMDEALREALATRVPEKNTGPDPDDVLQSLFEEELDEEEQARAKAGGREGIELAVLLGLADLERADRLLEMIRAATGEQQSVETALKLALKLAQDKISDLAVEAGEDKAAEQIGKIYQQLINESGGEI